MTRPAKFDEDLFAKILARLAQGESLLKICGEADMPWRNTFMRWLDADESGDRRVRYARARDDGLDVMSEQLLAIAGTAKPGVITVDKFDKLGQPITETTTKDTVDRDRLHADTLKWYLSKLAPKRYGDRIAVEHSGSVSIEDRLRAGRARVRGE